MTHTHTHTHTHIHIHTHTNTSRLRYRQCSIVFISANCRYIYKVLTYSGTCIPYTHTHTQTHTHTHTHTHTFISVFRTRYMCVCVCVCVCVCNVEGRLAGSTDRKLVSLQHGSGGSFRGHVRKSEESKLNHKRNPKLGPNVCVNLEEAFTCMLKNQPVEPWQRTNDVSTNPRTPMLSRTCVPTCRASKSNL
jgi:hypothetical protein